jgi:hypothetical protein
MQSHLWLAWPCRTGEGGGGGRWRRKRGAGAFEDEVDTSRVGSEALLLHPSRQKVINVSKLNDLRAISVEPRRLVSYSEFHEGYVGW